MNYYDLPEVSNSDLKELMAKEPLPNIQEIYDFGNLVDALKTEPHRILGNMLHLEGGRTVHFSDNDMFRAKCMVIALDNNQVARNILVGMKFQYVFVRKAFKIEYNGVSFFLPVRAKFDAIRPRDIGADIKTTACTTQKSFMDSFDYFDYDQQAAWYMDIAEIDRMIYFSISKKPNKQNQYDVFIVVIQRGDEIYNRGKEKYSALAYIYYFLIHCLKMPA